MMKCSTTRRRRFCAGLLTIALLLSLVPIQFTFAVDQNASDTASELRYWQLTVVKKDSGNGGIVAGYAYIAGSVYGLYNNNHELLDEYRVGEDGTFTTKKYVLGTGYYLQEIAASSGYKLDWTTYSLDAYTTGEYSSEAVIHNTITLEGDIMTGTVTISNFTANPEKPGIYNVPEEGAEFQIYLKSAGSYENAVALKDERLYDCGAANEEGDIVWSNGKIISKNLAYGTYMIHQVSSWDNRILVKDFEITILDDSQHFNFNLINPYYTANIVVNKRDAESGLMIVDGIAAFKILNVDTNKYASYYDEETGETIDEFMTVDGSMTLPMELPYGNYQLEETRTPEGYLLNTEPIAFSVNSSSSTLCFNIESTPLKGQLLIETTGFQFTSVTEKPTANFGPSFVPVYSEDYYIAGVCFNLIADEDIITGDGVVHYKKGDVVDTIRVIREAAVWSKELYVGKYLLVETEAPAGAILINKPIEVTNDGEQQVSTIPVQITNEYISTELSIIKQAYIWKTVIDEESGEITRKLNIGPGVGFTFGLFAAEDFVAYDGNLISQDSLIAVMVTDEQGVIHFTERLPYGHYYVRELDTPNNHSYIIDETVYDINLSTENACDNKITATVTSTAMEDDSADIKFQTKGNNLRLVTWVDSLDYKEVVFNVTIDGQTAAIPCTTVYSSINAGGVKLDNAADVFNENARYFVTYTIEEIPEGVTAFDVSVTWTDSEGNSRTSATRTITV